VILIPGNFGMPLRSQFIDPVLFLLMKKKIKLIADIASKQLPFCVAVFLCLEFPRRLAGAEPYNNI